MALQTVCDISYFRQKITFYTISILECTNCGALVVEPLAGKAVKMACDNN